MTLTHPVEWAEADVVAADEEAVVTRVGDDKGKLAVQVLHAVLSVLQIQRQNDLAVAASLCRSANNNRVGGGGAQLAYERMTGGGQGHA